jgi:hypothetical protein
MATVSQSLGFTLWCNKQPFSLWCNKQPFLQVLGVASGPVWVQSAAHLAAAGGKVVLHRLLYVQDIVMVMQG